MNDLPAHTPAFAVPAPAGLALAYHGKGRMNYVSPDEVAASRWLYDTAPKGSLLTGVTSDFPWAFVQGEWYDHARLAYLTPRERHTLDTDPARAVEEMASAGRHPHTCLILGRGEEVEALYTGEIPAKDLSRLEPALRRSAAFRVAFENRDATVFELAPPEPAPALGGKR